MEYVSTAKRQERRLASPILKGGPFVFNITLLGLKPLSSKDKLANILWKT
jgi:hypothetical protein